MCETAKQKWDTTSQRQKLPKYKHTYLFGVKVLNFWAHLSLTHSHLLGRNQTTYYYMYFGMWCDVFISVQMNWTQLNTMYIVHCTHIQSWKIDFLNKYLFYYSFLFHITSYWINTLLQEYIIIIFIKSNHTTHRARPVYTHRTLMMIFSCVITHPALSIVDIEIFEKC